MDHSQMRLWNTGQFRMDSFEHDDQRESKNDIERPHNKQSQMRQKYYDGSLIVETADIMTKEHKVIETISIRLNDEEAIKKYLKELLEMLQQQPLKRICKVWIKGVCPRKQSIFPYSKSIKQQGDDSREPIVPAWWPIAECIYREPDHVDKESRMALALHILRLRPTLEALRRYNNGVQLHAKQLKAEQWTEFLEAQTHSAIFDALEKKPEPEAKLKLRQKILRQIYFVAKAEEQYLKGERDGEDVIYMEANTDVAKVLGTKRPQSKKRSGEDLDFKASGTASRPQKKSKRATGQDVPQDRAMPVRGGKRIEFHDQDASDSSSSSNSDPNTRRSSHASMPRCKTSKPSQLQRIYVGPNGLPTAHAFFVSDSFPNGTVDHSASSSENSPMTTSFCSSQSSQDEMGRPSSVFEPIPGRQDFKCEHQMYQQRPVQVHNCAAVPQPHFETVPNTPIMSPIGGFARFAYGSGWPEEYPAAQPMQHYPVRQSPTIMPAYTMPMPVSQPPMMLNNQPFAPGPFVAHADRRSITPASDAPSVFHGNSYAFINYPEQHPHGLPMTYRHDFQTPEESNQPMPFPYPEPTPDANFPPAALPGPVIRGLTGYSSGVGEQLVKN